MKIQSSHDFEARGLDAYFSPPQAVIALLNIEKDYIPNNIWEPACGDGAISKVLLLYGYSVISSDIHDYGYEHGNCGPNFNYLNKIKPLDSDAIITNPPYRLALPFIEKAVNEVSYTAFLLRTNFLESTSRLPFFRRHPPSRIWISSRRLPMMHRHNWLGPIAPSNICHAWFIWEQQANKKCFVDWFDWKDYNINHSKDRSIL
jgi:hypothetical protein